MKEIDITQHSFKVVDLWMNQWLLLTAGSPKHCNMMTVAWGSIGCMWGKPFVQIVVRPQRYTYEFMEQYDTFTLCAFPEKYRKALQVLGSTSGRQGDKLGKTDLTFRASTQIPTPAYQEASFILECRKIYFQDLDPKGFLDSEIQRNYPKRDYHRVYFGEILAAFVEE